MFYTIFKWKRYGKNIRLFHEKGIIDVTILKFIEISEVYFSLPVVTPALYKYHYSFWKLIKAQNDAFEKLKVCKKFPTDLKS